MTDQPRAELDTLHCQACDKPLPGSRWRWCSRACQERAREWRLRLADYWKKKAA